jgi:hypothetical protein
MPKPRLKNIEDHLEKTRLYITKKIESFNLLVNQEAVDFENNRSFNIIGKPADIPAVMVTNTAFFRNPLTPLKLWI